MRGQADTLKRKNIALAKRKWCGWLGKQTLEALRSLSHTYGFSIALGDLILLDGGWYVTHAGLLRIARKGFGCRDADPSNVSPLVRGAEMRIAETRAVNRVYGIPRLQDVYRRFFLAVLLAFSLAHRASTAFRASSRLSWGVSFATLAFPPFRPPRRPKATAWGFLFLAMPIDSAKELLKKQGNKLRPMAVCVFNSLT